MYIPWCSLIFFLMSMSLVVIFIVNCWPSVSRNETVVNIEYEALKSLELKNVIVSIPLPALRDAPIVNQVDGDWR
jgi:hypothetical protein